MSFTSPFDKPAQTPRGPSIDEILSTAVRNRASDIHFSAGAPVRARIDGDLSLMPEFPDVIQPQWLFDNFERMMTPTIYENYKKSNESDISYSVPGAGRFRVNAFVQQALPGAVFRIIPTKIKSLEDLGMSEALTELTKKPKGLVLVTGPTGSGKSTTLAAMIDSINQTRPEHIMTIEDPIEFVHISKKSLINQREVGSDTMSFGEALKRVLRQDPDVILVGELRDAETISTALTAAETGHLVFGTLHTQSAVKTIDRIIDSFPGEQQSQVKSQLADTIQAVVAQSLLKRIGGGRVAATEVMIRTDAISNMIRDGKVEQIYSSIQAGAEHGMHTLDQELRRLVAAGIISRDEGKKYLLEENALDGVQAPKKVSYDEWEQN